MRDSTNVQSTSTKAKLAAEDIGIDVKETAEHALQGAKKMAKKVKDAASSAAESVKSAAGAAMVPMYEKDNELGDRMNRQNPDQDIYNRDNELYPTSDSAGAKSGYKLPLSQSDESAAAMSGSSIGEDVNSVRKSLLDDPQDMPQGVGKRAKSADGTPMETGTERS